MYRKKFILLAFSLFAVIVLALSLIYAWFIEYNAKIIIITGDIKISVKGWYQLASSGDEITYNNELTSLNVFDDITSGTNLLFKFEVVNESKRDASLAMRFSNFLDNIFENFSEYYKDGHTDTVNGKIAENAKQNTAKFSFMMQDIYYIDADGVKTSLTDNQLWLYSYGEYVFDSIKLPGITTGNDSSTIKKPVYLYFTLSNSQSLNAVDNYKKWLTGHESENGLVTGYGQEFCANLLGHTWNSLSDQDKTVINNYLTYFFEREIASISGKDESLILNLQLSYLEFIGSSIGNGA